MSEFAEYIGALFLYLVPVMGAGPFFVDRLITWFCPKGRQWLDAHPQRRQIYLWSFLLSLFVAGFIAWKVEHHKYMSVVLRKNVPTQTIVGGETYQILRDDYLLAVVSMSDKTTTLKLPSDPYRGQRFEIKDANGMISMSNPIVIDGNGHQIDRDNTMKMIQPYEAITVTYSGIKWIIT
jgi:hypothetical protein